MTHIAIVGPMHAGKSTLANILVEEHDYTRMGLADPVKDIACAMLTRFMDYHGDSLPDRWDGLVPNGTTILPIDRQEIEDGKAVFRPFLQWFGTDFVREYLKAPTFWIDRLAERVRAHDGPVVCDDVRFPNEAEALRDMGFRVIRLWRPEDARIASVIASGGLLEHLTHTTETKTEDIDADETFASRNLEDLELAAYLLAHVA